MVGELWLQLLSAAGCARDKGQELLELASVFLDRRIFFVVLVLPLLTSHCFGDL